MDNTYIFSMQEHLAELKSELQGLTEIITQRDLDSVVTSFWLKSSPTEKYSGSVLQLRMMRYF